MAEGRALWQVKFTIVLFPSIVLSLTVLAVTGASERGRAGGADPPHPAGAQSRPGRACQPDLCRFVEVRFGKAMLPRSMSRLVRGLGLSTQKIRPVHPKRDAKAAQAAANRGFARL